jgi:hypothetical protein
VPCLFSVKAVRTPDTAERIVQQGLDVVASSPAEFAAFYTAEPVCGTGSFMKGSARKRRRALH